MANGAPPLPFLPTGSSHSSSLHQPEFLSRNPPLSHKPREPAIMCFSGRDVYLKAAHLLPPGLRRYLEQPKVDRELTEKYRQPGYHPTHVSVGELQAGWAAAAPFHQPPLAASSYIKQQVTRFYWNLFWMQLPPQLFSPRPGFGFCSDKFWGCRFFADQGSAYCTETVEYWFSKPSGHFCGFFLILSPNLSLSNGCGFVFILIEPPNLEGTAKYIFKTPEVN